MGAGPNCRMGLMLSPRSMGRVLLAVQLLNPACYSQSPSLQQPYFEIWSPKRTGIVFKHDNALSSRRRFDSGYCHAAILKARGGQV